MHYVVEITTLMFNSVENASTVFDELTEMHPRDDSDLKLEYCPSYLVVIAKVSGRRESSWTCHA